MSAIGGVGGYSAAQYARPTFTPPKFTDLDSNGDQSLTLDELKAGAPKGASGTEADKRAEALFSAMDGDGDGSVTSAEKDAFDSKIAERFSGSAFMAQQAQGPSLADIFAETDSDGSGGVSLDEFGAEASDASSEMVQKLFDLIDGDGDGSISETESSDFFTQLQDELMAQGGPPPGGPPPGGPGGPGGPPPGAAANQDGSDSQDSEDSVANTLFAAAQSAYGASQKQNLLDQLASIFNEAA